MQNNYKTCNYYHDKGVKYALLGKEITLEEIIEIIKQSSITPMVEVLGLPSVAFSKRKLITNYYKDLNKESKESLDVVEKVTDSIYHLTEDKNGTSFFLKEIVNGTSIIKELFDNKLEYIIMRGYGIEEDIATNMIKVKIMFIFFIFFLFLFYLKDLLFGVLLKLQHCQRFQYLISLLKVNTYLYLFYEYAYKHLQEYLTYSHNDF